LVQCLGDLGDTEHDASHGDLIQDDCAFAQRIESVFSKSIKASNNLCSTSLRPNRIDRRSELAAVRQRPSASIDVGLLLRLRTGVVSFL
jgi:hypothetical protein